MKTSEEILLEEVKAQYTRHLNSWSELDSKSHNFLQLNGLILSIIVIGVISLDFSTNKLSSVMLIASAICIILSIVFGLTAITRKKLKEIAVKVSDDADLEGSEKKIMLAMIKQYDISIRVIDEKHKKRTKEVERAMYSLFIGLVFLITFVVTTFIENSLSLFLNSYM